MSETSPVSTKTVGDVAVITLDDGKANAISFEVLDGLNAALDAAFAPLDEGGAKAIVATARKIAQRVYRMLKYGQEYVRQSEAAYEAAYQLRLTKALAKKAASLGYKLMPTSVS